MPRELCSDVQFETYRRMISGKMKTKVKVQDSIRDEVERLAMRRDTSEKRPLIAIVPPPPSNAENSRLVVHWLNNGRRFKLCHKQTDMDWCPILLNYLLKEKVTYSSTIQSCMWPALTKLQSVVCIAGEEQGKTVGWVLPLLNSLLDTDLYQGLPKGESPRAVVLCSGHVSAGKTEEALKRVVIGAGLELKIVTASKAGRGDTVDFINGCDVLVSSPARMVELIKGGVTGLDRCCHLVVEDAEVTLEIHQKAFGDLLLAWRRKKTVEQNMLPDQVVVVGEEWSKPVKFLTEKILVTRWKPTVVFGSLLEAAVYIQLPLLTSFHLEYQDKFRSLLNILRNNQDQRVVICCNRWKISSDLFRILENNGVMPMVLKKCEYEDMVDLTSSLSVWLDSPRGVPLLVSDDLLVVLSSIPGVADCLVHWDMPLASKKIFSIRFLFVKDALQHVSEKGELKKAEVHHLLGRRDKHSFPTLVQLLKRCRGDVPSEVLKQVDNEKHGMGRLCERMVEGRLNCSSHCGKRHWLDKGLDQGLVVDRRLEGIIEFLILRVETPVLYWVRVVDSMYDRDFQRRVLRMATHFCRKESCVQLSPELIEVGDVVAVEGDDEVYHRARVLGLECKEYKEVDKLVRVKVFLVDEGIAESFHPSRIYKIPESLGLDTFVAGATPVTVTGILPPDNDPDWSSDCAELVASYLTPVQRIDREEVCRGRVLLHTTTMLWVDRCQMMVKQPTISRFVLHFETYSWLVSQNWAVPNTEHAPFLHKLAVEGGLEIADTRSQVEEVEEVEDDISCRQAAQTIGSPLQYGDTPRRAFLPLHTMVPVCMSECVTPDHFYLQLSSQLNSLTRLEQEVAAWASEFQQYGLLLLPVAGQLVLAKVDQDSQYLRAEVRHVGDRLVVFMVDTGEMATVLVENTLPCPDSLAYKIPHQAVQCSLAGVMPVSGDWAEEAGDELFELSRDSVSDEALVLVCQVSQVTSTGYSVRLTSTGTGRDVDLATELLTAGLAVKDKELSEEVDRMDINELSMDLDGDTPGNMFNLDRVLEACAAEPENDQTDVQIVPDKTITGDKPSACDPISIPLPISPTPTVPADMPSLALVSNLSQYSTVAPRLTWWQTLSCLHLSVLVETMRDLKPAQVHVMVTQRTIVVQVLEQYMGRTVLHSLPCSELDLLNMVVPGLTEVVVKARVVTIRLSKLVKEAYWGRLGEGKFDWIRRDMNSLQDGATAKGVNGQSDGIKRETHRETGEEILQEEFFDSNDEHEQSNSDEDEGEELLV